MVETETQEAEKKLQSFQTAWQMGARIKESDVMDAIGASIPTEADRVLQSPQSQGGGMPPGAASMFGQAGFGPGKQQQPEAPESKSDGVKEDQTEQYAAQKRAKQGGETGANGEWYEGGQFIATTQHAKVPQAEKKRGTGKQEIEPYKWEVGPDGHRSIFKAISGVFGRLGDARRGQDPEKMYLRDDEGLPQSLQHFGVDLEDAKKLVDLFNSGERWYRSHPGNSWKIASDSDVEQYAKREWHEDQHSRDKNGEFSRKSESGETASAGGDPEDDQLSHLSSEDRQVVDYVANMLFMKEMNVSDAVKHLKSKGKDLGMETAWAWNQLKEQSRQRVREGKRAKRESAGDVPQKESSATNSDPQSQRKSLLDAVDSHGPHAIISAAELRKSLSHVFPTKEAFDNAVMDLAGDGVMNLHWYDHKMSDQEREDFIQGDNGLYYNAMNRRSSSYSRETEDLEQYARKDESSESENGEHWITINADSGDGTHIKIGGDGKIVAGPKELMDRNISSLGKGGKPEPSKKHTDDEWNEAQSNYDHLLATKGRGHELTQAAKKRLAEMYENDLKSDAPQGSQATEDQRQETQEELWDRINSAEPANLGTMSTEDWGTLRGQGKRSGGMVMGGMRDSTLTGKKNYINLFGQLPKEESDEANSLYGKGIVTYLKARAIGLSHDQSMVAANESVGDADVGDAHRYIYGSPQQPNEDGGPTQLGAPDNPRVGDVVQFPPSEADKRIGFGVRVVGRDGNNVTVSMADNEHAKSTMSLDSYRQFTEDMSGRVGDVPKTDNPAINSVIDGEGEYIGKGDDSIAFRVGDKVVKVSTTVPYHPLNRPHRTPEEAIANAVEQFKVAKEMKSLGIPGIPSQSIRESGDRAFTVRDYLEIPGEYTAEQLSQIRESLMQMHKHGFTINDQIQPGIGKDGKVYHADTSKATDNRQESEDYQEYRASEDQSQLQSLYQQAGMEDKFVPWGKRAKDHFETWEEQQHYLGKRNKSPTTFDHVMAKYADRDRKGYIAEHPDLEDKINARFSAALKARGMDPSEFGVSGEKTDEVKPPSTPGNSPDTEVGESSVGIKQSVFEQAVDSGATPREAADYASQAYDPDYAFARKSAVPNAGEDLLESAHRKQNGIEKHKYSRQELVEFYSRQFLAAGSLVDQFDAAFSQSFRKEFS